LGNEVRRPKVLLCYNYQNGITDEEEDIILTIELELFSIGTISLPNTIQSMKTIDAKPSNSKLKSRYKYGDNRRQLAIDMN
jgi:hypothetical protein